MDIERHVVTLDTVKSFSDYLCVESTNDMVGVIDLWEVGNITHVAKYFGLYCVVCVFSDDASADYAARLYFIRPGQYGRYSSGVSPRVRGWILCFHPDMLHGTLLANRMSEYSFFNESSSNVMYLDAEESQLVDKCISSIRAEIYHPCDRFTRRIFAAGIAVLLTQCLRLYDHCNGENALRNRDIVRRVDILLNDHFSSPIGNRILPTVSWCAKQLRLSPNYLGDLMRKHGGVSAQEHIHRRIVEEIKTYLERNTCSIGHIAHILGFKHPHHLSRIFRKAVGCTPQEYRQRLHESLP